MHPLLLEIHAFSQFTLARQSKLPYEDGPQQADLDKLFNISVAAAVFIESALFNTLI